jgi:hypothetical protein
VDVSPATLELTIDEVVLDGVTPDNPAVREAVRRALESALASHGLATSTAQLSVAVTRAVSIHVSDRGTP